MILTSKSLRPVMKDHEHVVGWRALIRSWRWPFHHLNGNDLVKSNQSDFKKSKFDVLVATKGFGMGIDKSSVRFILHTSLSSGMESWYQEVGRAGRDNERAHIMLLVDPPKNDLCSKRVERTGDQKTELYLDRWLQSRAQFYLRLWQAASSSFPKVIRAQELMTSMPYAS